MPKEDYVKSHKGLAIACHDVFIEYNEGILLVLRDNYPAKNVFWPVGGKINRGMRTKPSLIKKAKEECGLRLENIIELENARTFFKTDPFRHGKGTDTPVLVYFARGKGKLKLDKLHKDYTIVTSEKYTKKFRASLEEYPRDYLDDLIPMIKHF